MKPDWSEAADDMMWLVKESDGGWWFTTIEPIPTLEGCWKTPAGGQGRWQYAGMRDYGDHPDWDETKESRP